MLYNVYHGTQIVQCTNNQKILSMVDSSFEYIKTMSLAGPQYMLMVLVAMKSLSSSRWANCVHSA